MPSARSRIGRKAEILAASKLGQLGYRIVGWNYRCPYGEIDLIAEHGNCLVFVEVRCRKERGLVAPAESVTPAKQQRLIATAQSYLEEHPLTLESCRFDVVEVVSNNDQLCIHKVIHNAFSA